MSKLYARVIGELVDGIAIAEEPLNIPGEVWIDVTDSVPPVGTMWTYKKGVFAPPIPPLPPPNIITKVAFRFRFTDAEYAAILAVAKADTEVQAWYETFNMAATIDLDSQRTKDGVAKLVSKNLLTQARADEILTAPVQPNERA